MTRQFFSPLLLAALLGLSQCQKNDAGPAKPEDQLPPATQTGQHTFGCLLNGQPWTPGGNVGPLNYRLIYDAGYAGGDLEIRAYRYAKTSASTTLSTLISNTTPMTSGAMQCCFRRWCVG